MKVRLGFFASSRTTADRIISTSQRCIVSLRPCWYSSTVFNQPTSSCVCGTRCTNVFAFYARNEPNSVPQNKTSCSTCVTYRRVDLIRKRSSQLVIDIVTILLILYFDFPRSLSLSISMLQKYKLSQLKNDTPCKKADLLFDSDLDLMQCCSSTTALSFYTTIIY